MKFILIVLLHSSYLGKSPTDAVGFQEFDSKAQCQYAADLIMERSLARRTDAFCVNKK